MPQTLTALDSLSPPMRQPAGSFPAGGPAAPGGAGRCIRCLALAVLAVAACSHTQAADEAGGYSVYPSRRATNVNPDTHLRITFGSPPAAGTSGMIRVYDAQTNELVDSIDMSISAGPNPSLTIAKKERAERAAAGLPEPPYQEMVIDGFEGFHFYPVIVRGNVATIDLHSHVLDYGRLYRVEIDPGVIEHDGFTGIGSGAGWTFSTKADAPRPDATRLTVDAGGGGDFSTLQGAIEFVPDKPAERVTIVVKRGVYEEIVFFRNKSKLTIRGEDRDATVVGYGNNSAFNPGRNGLSYRPAFSALNSSEIRLTNFTINNYSLGQAEALKVTGDRNTVERMTLNGSGDALTLRGTIYLVDSKLTGHGDTILSYGSAFFERCELRSIGPLQWIRNPEGAHGHIFKDCVIVGIDEPLPWSVTDANPAGYKTPAVLARLPNNHGQNYPFAEFVLIDCRMSGIVPEGVVSVEPEETFNWENVRFWEHNTMNLDGDPLDLSKRHPIMRELKTPEDAALIERYSDPAQVLNGWTPEPRSIGLEPR